MNEELCNMTTDEVMALAEAEYLRRKADADVPQSDAEHPYKIGRCYLIRTVTMTQIGRVVWVGEHELLLSDPSWIPDTGRFHQALRDPNVLDEVEPGGKEAIIGRGAIVDVWPWNHPLPASAK